MALINDRRGLRHPSYLSPDPKHLLREVVLEEPQGAHEVVDAGLPQPFADGDELGLEVLVPRDVDDARGGDGVVLLVDLRFPRGKTSLSNPIRQRGDILRWEEAPHLPSVRSVCSVCGEGGGGCTCSRGTTKSS